jgi:hypothetical protein
MRVCSAEKAASRAPLLDFPQFAERYPREKVWTSRGQGRREAFMP